MRAEYKINHASVALLDQVTTLDLLLRNKPKLFFFSDEDACHLPNQCMTPKILLLTSYPPRECGIATYSQDLIAALNNKYEKTFEINVCALESENEKHAYDQCVTYILNTDKKDDFINIAEAINADASVEILLVQHEFGFFCKSEAEFEVFLDLITKPKIIVFHTVLPRPDSQLHVLVQNIVAAVDAIIVMTNSSSAILVEDYFIRQEKISVIPHGTHLVEHSDKDLLKEKYAVSGKQVLSTFGLLSSGKSIETSLKALPAIVKTNPDVLFLIIGKTHPSVLKQDGEVYRDYLETLTIELGIENNVKFINRFLPLNELLEYLQLTDIYLFTSKDPNQAVSGTFSYAISCGCPIISTPIPHAKEILQQDMGSIIDFENSKQLADEVINLLEDDLLRTSTRLNSLHKMASTTWENAAILHANLFEKLARGKIKLQYKIPKTNLKHLKKLSTDFGIIQFSKINQPDISSGYTLDDNARGLITVCQHFELTGDEQDLVLMRIYLNFIQHCLSPNGYFYNYVDYDRKFTQQNNSTNLSDSIGRAIWALGYVNSMMDILPLEISTLSNSLYESALRSVLKIHSTRAMGFVIKGMYYHQLKTPTTSGNSLIKNLADRLVQMYRHEATNEWQWFESYLTYANSILPEALLCAYMSTGDEVYKQIAKTSFDFLLSKIFNENQISVISNKGWLHRGQEKSNESKGGEQAIDVAYTIMALQKFYNEFKIKNYRCKMRTAFEWFLGNNHLNQIIYNPCTGGCYDGLEMHSINLNQGAESTLSYLMAKFTIEKSFENDYSFYLELEYSHAFTKQKHFA